MAIITLSVDDELLNRFRQTAYARYGKKKGALKKVFVDAVSSFLDKEYQDEITQRQLSWLRKKWGTGGLLTKSREEWYE